MSIKRAAKGLVQAGMPVTDGILNKIEMAFRAYDPCLGCATHALPGETPMIVRIYNHQRELVQELRRD
jgi:F420-non-reducing hydrogenase large subunit